MLKVESIAENVKRYIEQCIFNGEFEPGQWIKELELSERLGISRPPIREALKLLEAEGLIKKKPNKGATVLRLNRKDLWEIYTLKMKLYEMATDLAFEKILKKHIQKWEILLKKMETCLRKRPYDIKKYQQLNKEFHNIMIEISGHGRLNKIISILHNQVKPFSYRSLSHGQHMEQSIKYHQKIVDAIRRGEKEETIKLTKDHILKAMELLQKIIEEDG